MYIKIEEQEFEISTKLGTTFKLEKKFKKPYMNLLQTIADLTAEEQIGMLQCGISEQSEAIKFKELLLEKGIGDLSEYLEVFIDGLQYPGFSEEQIEEKKLKKIAKQKHMREIGLII